jgi:hypothetical protein
MRATGADSRAGERPYKPVHVRLGGHEVDSSQSDTIEPYPITSAGVGSILTTGHDTNATDYIAAMAVGSFAGQQVLYVLAVPNVSGSILVDAFPIQSNGTLWAMLSSTSIASSSAITCSISVDPLPGPLTPRFVMVGVPDTTTTPSGATPNLYIIPVADSTTGVLSTTSPTGFLDGDTDVNRSMKLDRSGAR